jgi:Na+/H+ antiporter NhaD/arsenite permease-like protein
MQTATMVRVFFVAFIGSTLTLDPARAASLNGAELPWPWGVPFVGLLLTIAIGPLLFPKIWHDHYSKITVFWSALALAPILLFHGVATAGTVLARAILIEYLSFIVLLFALYTVAGGILVTGQIKGKPINNTFLLALGTIIASFVGTTGAAMILIRPIIRANYRRRHNTHVIVFFIILIANIGGALTPLGDPPLFVGFLHGVDFLWPMRNLWLQTTIVAALVLAFFFVIDLLLSRQDQTVADAVTVSAKIGVRGLINIPLIALIIATLVLPAFWKPGGFSIAATNVEFQNVVCDLMLVGIALLSLWLTPDEHRSANGFSWQPIREVGILFAGIFITVAPVVAMLHAGRNGPFVFLLNAVVANNGLPHEAAYFWLTGILSAFLDNAPTYLVFFELAGGDAAQLTGPLAGTLAAISMGAVYMGALTYVGNAPNFMVYAIAKESGIKMPSFFVYSLYASLVLLPLFLLLTLLPIAPILKLG